MRVPVLSILIMATVLAAAPAAAQTYDPAFPVCLHVYTRGANYYECRLYLDPSVQRGGFGPLRPVHRQSIFCRPGRASDLSAPPPLLPVKLLGA